MRIRTVVGWAALSALAPLHGAAGQGIVVDQGRFDVTIDGQPGGIEEFTIRRAGVGRDDAFYADATVRLGRADSEQMRTLLRADPPDGVAGCAPTLGVCYQVEVTGEDRLRSRMTREGRRYVAIVNTARGEEHREFSALTGTRVLERDVAHHYYFLRDVREGSVTPVVEPRSRSRTELTAGPVTEEQLTVGQGSIEAFRVELTSEEERRVVWFDRLGRVLRVSIPARGYLAERVDLLR